MVAELGSYIRTRPRGGERPVFAIHQPVPSAGQKHMRLVDGRSVHMSLRLVNDRWGDSMWMARVTDAETGFKKTYKGYTYQKTHLDEWMKRQGLSKLDV
jgi:hypothetical protein